MPINIENVQALHEKAYHVHARRAFGEAGALGLTALLNAVKLIFQRCPPESLPGTLTIVRSVTATPSVPAIACMGSPITCTTYKEVGKFLSQSSPGSHGVVEVSLDGTFRVLALGSDINLITISEEALVYRFDDGSERILAKHYEDFLLKVSPLLKSNFATPTLDSLEDALARYSDMALETECRILANIWEGGVDGPRLVLVNKPEALMRDSLCQALQLLTRDASVRPEQNTDETRPVDIRVEWFGSGASALIEVKWLGKSTAKPRVPRPKPGYTVYGQPRAQDGADQLADYMDREVRHSNATVFRGYLVIFDARRRNTKGASDRLSKDDAMHFAKDVLVFNPDHSMTRHDFDLPVRVFMNPRKSWFLAA